MRLTRMLSKNAITICNHSKKLIFKRLSFSSVFWSFIIFPRDPNQLPVSRKKDSTLSRRFRQKNLFTEEDSPLLLLLSDYFSGFFLIIDFHF